MSDIEVTTFPVAPLGCNCSILLCKSTKEAIVVDPGGEGPRIVAMLKEKECRVRWIVHTHAHFDHVLGTHDVAEHSKTENSDVKVCLHPGDFYLYDIVPVQGRMFGISASKMETPINHKLEDEQTLGFGKAKLKVLHTPGHTPGSCSFSVEDSGLLFSGDTLFLGSIGRTDLPGGDSALILKSIKDRLFVLDDGTQVIPGHGDFTRIYDEKHYNPFF